MYFLSFVLFVVVYPLDLFDIFDYMFVRNFNV
jgi:hypothetical protein